MKNNQKKLKKTLNCSTWNILLLLIPLFFTSCKKEDPNPELKDAIYQDILAQEGENQKVIADIDKKIEEAKKTLAESKPQTGEIKRNTKRLFDLESTKAKLKQQEMFWKIRKFERLKFVRRNKSLSTEEEWTTKTKSEYEIYLSEKKLRQAKNSWDLKQRFRDEGLTYDPLLMGEGPAAVKKDSGASSGGGGGH